MEEIKTILINEIKRLQKDNEIEKYTEQKIKNTLAMCEIAKVLNGIF